MQVTKVEKKLEQLLGIKERNKTTEMKKEKQNGAKAKQKEIANILSDMFEKERCVKEIAEAVIEQIDTMKKAILARAFRGELGTNDPSEESAVELLKRVLSGGEN